MGYTQTWLAVKTGTAETVLPRLGMRETGQREDTPESPLVGAELPGDWYVVIAGTFRHPLLTLETAQRLSTENDVVLGLIDERVMFCETSYWRRGDQLWRAQHDAQKGLDHLDADGELPPHLEALHAGYLKKQADAAPNAGVDHLFSVPTELARSLTGYMHDDDMAGIGSEPYEILEVATGGVAAPSASRPWWKRLTGG